MDAARRYNVTLSGLSPLLMHHDNVPFSDVLKVWQKTPKNKKRSVAGDDRSPAWTWLGYCYHDGKQLIVPSDNSMTAIRDGAKLVPTGKRGGSFKSVSQSAIVCNEIGWPLISAKGAIPWPALEALMDEPDFSAHCAAATALGFELFVKRATIGMSKNIRVRPRLDSWTATGSLTVQDDRVSQEILESILSQAGAYAGLMDWRPSSRTPGQFGRFTVRIAPLPF
jgi:hypothetical protein